MSMQWKFRSALLFLFVTVAFYSCLYCVPPFHYCCDNNIRLHTKLTTPR